MKGRSTLILALILVATAGLITLSALGIGNYQTMSLVNIRQGLDLQGGVSILYEAGIANPTGEDMAAANNLLRARLDSRGYTEATVMQEGLGQIRVDIPGVDDAEAAVREIGATAMLTFEDENGMVWLTGANVSRATSGVQTSAHGGAPEVVVNLEFDSEGTRLFGEATRNNIGRTLMIFMDDELISAGCSCCNNRRQCCHQRKFFGAKCRAFGYTNPPRVFAI